MVDPPVIRTSERKTFRRCPCGRMHYARGMCKVCYQRWRGKRPVPAPILPGSTQKGHVTSPVSGAHQRKRAKDGPATGYSCVDCGKKRAYDWSRTHHANPAYMGSYKPRCRRCHMDYDGHYNKELLRQRWEDPEFRSKMTAVVSESNKRR